MTVRETRDRVKYELLRVWRAAKALWAVTKRLREDWSYIKREAKMLEAMASVVNPRVPVIPYEEILETVECCDGAAIFAGMGGPDEVPKFGLKIRRYCARHGTMCWHYKTVPLSELEDEKRARHEKAARRLMKRSKV